MKSFKITDGPPALGHPTRKGPGIMPLRRRWQKVRGGWRDANAARQVPSGPGTIGERDRLVGQLLAEGHAEPSKEARRRMP